MDLTRQPPFPPDACPVCGRPGQDGHFCEECVGEMERRGLDWEMMEPEQMRAALAAAPQAEAEESAPQPAATPPRAPKKAPPKMPETAPETAPGEVPAAGVRWGVLITACCVLAVMFWFVHREMGDLFAYWTASERAEVEAHLVGVKTSCLRSERLQSASYRYIDRVPDERKRDGRWLTLGAECEQAAVYEYSIGGKTHTYESVPRRTDHEFDLILWQKTHRHGYYRNSKGEWVRVGYVGTLELLQIAVGALAVCAVALYFVWRELRKLRRRAG